MKINCMNKENKINNDLSVKVVEENLSKKSKKGDVFVAKVDKISNNTYSINFGPQFGSVEMNKDANHEMLKEGDLLYYEVKSIENGKAYLSEICKETSQHMNLTPDKISSKDVYNNMDVMKKIAERNDEKNNDKDENSISDDDILGRLNNNAVEEKIEQILNYEDIYVNDLSVEKFLNVVISNVEKNENFIYNEKMSTQDLLKSINVNDTLENRNLVEAVLEKIKVINQLEEKSIANILKNDMPLTLNNIYKSVCNSKYGISNSVDLQNIEDIDSEIKKILEANGIKDNMTNENAVKKLIENEIDINEKNVRKYKELEMMNKNLVIEDILQRLAVNIQYGNINDLYIGNEENIKYEVNEIKESLDIVSNDLSILKNINNSNQITSNVTIDQIRKYIDENNIKYKNVLEPVELNESYQEVRENINMIRLTLTVDSMLKMYDKGIDVNISSIKEAANKLRDISSNEAKVNNMKLYEKTSEDISKLSVRDFRIYTNVDTDNANLDYFAQKNSSLDIINSYEGNMIKSNYKLNAEIKIAEKNIDEILKMNKLEINDINRKSALALSINQMDITNENVSKIADMEEKLSFVVENLEPKITLKMIEEGYDPTLMDINEVISYIEETNANNGKGENENKDENNNNSNEKIYNELTVLLNNNRISDEKKQALIGIYRAMNKINATKEVGIANLIDNENVNLTNIYNSTKRIEKMNTAIDVSLDDQFGMLESITNGDNNAINLIRNSLNELREQRKDNREEANKLISRINEIGKKKEIAENIFDDIRNTRMEDFENLANFEESKKDFNDVVEYLDTMIENIDLKKTIRKTTEDIENNKYEEIIEDINEYRNNITIALSNLINDEKFDDVEVSSSIKNIETVDKVIKPVGVIKKLNNDIRMMRKNEGVYQLPFYIDDEITNINLYFKSNESSNNISIDLSTIMPNMGELTCNVSLDGRGSTIVNINIENKDAIIVMKEYSNEVEEIFKSMGYENVSVKLNGFKINSTSASTKDSSSRVYSRRIVDSDTRNNIEKYANEKVVLFNTEI